MRYYAKYSKVVENNQKRAKANYLVVVKGYSQAKAAKEIGVAVKTIHRWIKQDYSVSEKPFKYDEKKAVAKFLLDRGYSNNEISTVLMVSNTTIGNWISDYKWKDTEVKNIDVGGDIAILCWSFLQFIRDCDPGTFLKVMDLIKIYRNPSKIGIENSEVDKLPECLLCKHLIGDTWSCTAFPDGIPQKIKQGSKHLKPLEGQGNDIVFTTK